MLLATMTSSLLAIAMMCLVFWIVFARPMRLDRSKQTDEPKRRQHTLGP